MAGCPAGTVVSNSSMASTCLRISCGSKFAPTCGHSMSSRVTKSTESLAFFGAGTDMCSAGSGVTDSVFLVALCTDTPVERGQMSYAALQFRSPRASTDYVAAKCMILMEKRIARDGLDHILD